MHACIPPAEVVSGVYLDICFYASQRPNFSHISSQHRPGVPFDAKAVGRQPPSFAHSSHRKWHSAEPFSQFTP